MNLYDYYLSLWRDMHQYKNGAAFLRPVKRGRGSLTGDFSYSVPVFGYHKLSDATVQRMIGYGWCRITALDADTEYITSAEEGRKVARYTKEIV